jgi:hypothetical protein
VLTNVPVGKTYYLYYDATGTTPPDLPSSFMGGLTVNITDDMAGQDVIVDF